MLLPVNPFFIDSSLLIMDPKQRMTSAAAMEDYYFREKDEIPLGKWKIGQKSIVNFYNPLSEDAFGDGPIVYPKREFLTDEERKKDKAKAQAPAGKGEEPPSKRIRIEQQQQNEPERQNQVNIENGWKGLFYLESRTFKTNVRTCKTCASSRIWCRVINMRLDSNKFSSSENSKTNFLPRLFFLSLYFFFTAKELYFCHQHTCWLFLLFIIICTRDDSSKVFYVLTYLERCKTMWVHFRFMSRAALGNTVWWSSMFQLTCHRIGLSIVFLIKYQYDKISDNAPRSL